MQTCIRSIAGEPVFSKAAALIRAVLGFAVLPKVQDLCG
jgi:hypothetical protein